MEKIQEITYLDLGFNIFGLNLPIGNSFQSANLNDAFFELSENSVSNKKVKSISADKITAGTLAAITNVGDESIVLDGENRTIKIYDDSSNVTIYMAGGSA